MPNRILKESICTSEELAAISPEAEVLFYRLIVKADDFGLFHGNPKLLASLLFPLTTPPEKKVEAWLVELCSAGLVQLYEIDGKRYLKLVSFSKHQQPRAKNSKFPHPQAYASNCNQMQAYASNCGQMLPINDNDNGNDNVCDNDNGLYCTEPTDGSSMPEPEQPEERPIITLPLNDGTEYPILQADVDQWSGLYPAVDVMQQLRAMRGWLDANPTKRKTKAGVRRFINSWLAREQDKGGSAPRRSPKKSGKGDPESKRQMQEFSEWAFRATYAGEIDATPKIDP